MQILVKAIFSLFHLFFTFYCYVLILRLWMQKFRANAFNPVSKFVIRVTDPLIKPVRYIVPGFGGFDGAIILLALLAQWVLWVVTCKYLLGFFPPWSSSIVASLLRFVVFNVNFFMFVIFVCALMSWFPNLRGSPVVSILEKIASPLLLLVKRRVPVWEGIDFSPAVVLLCLYLLKSLFLIPLLTQL